jgi:hypothetical protein
MAAGGTVNALFSATVQQGGSDIVSLDFDAPFTVVEAPDTYVTIDIADDGINSQHYATGSIDTAHIAADQIDATLIADDAIDSEHYTDASIDLVHLAADSVDGTKIVDDAINSEHYAAGSIDFEHMSVNSIDSDQYVDASIDLAHLSADSVDGTKIVDDAIDSEHYADGSIDAVHLAADVIDETKLANDSLDSEHYNDASIDPAHLNFVVPPGAGTDEYAVTYEHSTGNFELVVLAGGADINEVGLCTTGACTDDFIDGTDLVDNAVAAEHITADVVNSQHYAAGSIDTEHIAADQIDSTLIADNAINSEHYTDGSIDPVHLNFVVAPGAGTDEYVISYEHSTANFELVASAGASLEIEDGDVQVETSVALIDFDGTVFNVVQGAEAADVDVDIADDGLDSQHYNTDSIDDEHINWADITNLSAGGVLNSLGADVAVGAWELQSTGNIVLQLGDAAGTNVFEIEDSGGIEIFQVDSNGVINPSETPDFTLQDSTASAAGTATISFDALTATYDAVGQIRTDDSTGEDTVYMEIDGTNEVVSVLKPLSYRANVAVVDITSADYAVSGDLCYGGVILAYHTVDNGNDVNLDACDCESVTTVTDGPHVTVYQHQASDSIEIYPGANEAFKLPDATILDNGDELDSPGTAYVEMNYVKLACWNTNNQWLIMDIQSVLSTGVIANDLDLQGYATAGYWQDGGVAD